MHGSIALTPAAARELAGDRRRWSGRQGPIKRAVKFFDTQVVHAAGARLGAANAVRPASLSVVLTAGGSAPVPLLLLAIDQRLALAAALPPAVAVAAIAALTEEEPSMTLAAEELKQQRLIARAATSTRHVRSADGRFLDLQRKACQSPSDGPLLRTGRRARVSRPGPSSLPLRPLVLLAIEPEREFLDCSRSQPSCRGALATSPTAAPPRTPAGNRPRPSR